MNPYKKRSLVEEDVEDTIPRKKNNIISENNLNNDIELLIENLAAPLRIANMNVESIKLMLERKIGDLSVKYSRTEFTKNRIIEKLIKRIDEFGEKFKEFLNDNDNIHQKIHNYKIKNYHLSNFINKLTELIKILSNRKEYNNLYDLEKFFSTEFKYLMKYRISYLTYLEKRNESSIEQRRVLLMNYSIDRHNYSRYSFKTNVSDSMMDVVDKLTEDIYLTFDTKTLSEMLYFTEEFFNEYIRYKIDYIDYLTTITLKDMIKRMYSEYV